MGHSPFEKITATMTLTEGNKVVASWNGSGAVFLSLKKQVSVTKGKTYKLTVNYKTNGKPQACISVVKTHK